MEQGARSKGQGKRKKSPEERFSAAKETRTREKGVAKSRICCMLILALGTDKRGFRKPFQAR